MAKRPYRISTHIQHTTKGDMVCTASPGKPCPRQPAYAVTEIHAESWDGHATCEQHAGRLLWQILRILNEGSAA